MKQSNTVARRWLTPLSAALLSLYAASGYAANCEYIVDNEWNNGFVAKIKITNDSNSAINGWDITWSYSGDNTVSNSWNATLSGTNPYTASALSWNSSIAAGQSVEFGMQGSKGSGAAEIPTLSGSVCSSNPQPTSTPQPTPTVAPTPTATPTITPTPTPTPTVTPTPMPTPTATPIPGNALHMEPPIAIPANRKIEKSSVWYTYPQNRGLPGYGNFGATGAFWGHPPNQNFYNDTTINNWANQVQGYRNQGLEYTARSEFDWAWKWFIEFQDRPDEHWVRTLDNDVVSWDFGPEDPTYLGYESGWVSNHSPAFVDYFKSQVDQIFKANISHFMFDSQTSSTRSTDLNQFGGDFSRWAMDGFREYMDDNYTEVELRAKGINDISDFNYRNFLISAGYTHTSYMAGANRVSGGVPLMEDFIYFNRKVLNEKMAEILSYIRSIDPNIEIGATTAVTEARGYIFDKNISFLAGEHAMGAANFKNEMPINIIGHLKAAEAVDKTLIYFPYPWEFANLFNRNAPQQARGWIAQSYAMGGIFSVPAAVWVGGSGVWNINADNYRDIYQFVSNNADLFDDYEAYSKIGLVSPMMAYLDATWIDGSNTMLGSIRRLIESNLNFGLLIFGDPGTPVVPRVEDFAKYDTIIVDRDRNYLTAEQQALLNRYSNKVLDLTKSSDAAAIDALRINNISVSISGSIADDTVTALSRVHKSNNDAPYIIHLLNRPLNSVDGTTPELDNISIAIPDGYFDEAITQATLHLPGGGSSRLSLSQNASGDTVMTVNNLGVWGIIELGH